MENTRRSLHCSRDQLCLQHIFRCSDAFLPVCSFLYWKMDLLFILVCHLLLLLFNSSKYFSRISHEISFHSTWNYHIKWERIKGEKEILDIKLDASFISGGKLYTNWRLGKFFLHEKMFYCGFGKFNRNWSWFHWYASRRQICLLFF